MKIEVLYPELCNLYGDLANAEYLARSCGAELVRTGLHDAPRFLTEDVALVYMGGTTERGQSLVRDAFAPHLEALVRRTDAGGVTLVTVGFKSQFGHAYGLNGDGLFRTVRGAGLNPDMKAEGIRRDNLMLTYLLGPLVVLNPPFAKYLLGLMGVTEPALAFEEAAMDVYAHRLAQFSEPERGFIYH